MRQLISIVLMWLMATQLVPTAFGAESVAAQIGGIPTGALIEVHLKDKQKIHGSRGATTDVGFTLVNANAGDQQIAFADVVSVKQVGVHKSHVARNIIIVAVVAIAVVATVIGIQYARCGPLGCGPIKI